MINVLQKGGSIPRKGSGSKQEGDQIQNIYIDKILYKKLKEQVKYETESFLNLLKNLKSWEESNRKNKSWYFTFF